MNAKLILTEALVEVGEMLGTEIHGLYMDGANDTRVNYAAHAACLAIVYGEEADQIEKDLERIAQEKQAKLHADLVARIAGEEMVAEHGEAMTVAAIKGIEG